MHWPLYLLFSTPLLCPFVADWREKKIKTELCFYKKNVTHFYIFYDVQPLEKRLTGYRILSFNSDQGEFSYRPAHSSIFVFDKKNVFSYFGISVLWMKFMEVPMKGNEEADDLSTFSLRVAQTRASYWSRLFPV